MPGQRYRQAGFWRYRYGKCAICGHCDKYEVSSQRGMRLRHRKCRECGALLGRNANSRATPDAKLASSVEMLARKYGVGWSRN